MDAKAVTPRVLFDGTVNYEVPPFQRPYVWTEEDQWQPLWDDLERLTADLIDFGGLEGQSESLPSHFLGAIVVKFLVNASGDPARKSVIDGQQRLTTLQLLLDAAHSVTEEFGRKRDAESLKELVLNGAERFKSTPRRFKLWPSRIDRPAFEHVMDDELGVPKQLADSRIAQAHRFFKDAIREWAEVSSDPDKAALRLSTLSDVLQQRLQIVSIDLGVNDDDQLIFETLNDRGTPLLAADLIKNFVFQLCENLGADVDAWGDLYWQDFDGDWWRDQVSQGRLFRSRIDLFLQYWLTMRTRSEIPTDAVFARFRSFASEHLADRASAEWFLRGLRSDADKFRDLAALDPNSASGRFYNRVVESLELGAFIPLLLWMISDNHNPPPSEADKALTAMESWAVRRTLLRRTMKDINKLVVALLQELDQHPLDGVGDATTRFLAKQTADSREWPTDSQVLAELPGVKMYGNIKQQRLRTILSALELWARTARSEQVSLPSKLEIEHVMPRGWRTHWGARIAQDPKLAANRDALINTLGNLTLVTQKLNVELSNRPWRDEEASLVAPTGKDAAVGKRSLIQRFSLLVLNKEIVDGHEAEWTDQEIRDRSARLARAVTEVWPR
ncbi:MAG TPA: DUF262 domain-containing protein [Acidimicrobiia bacterium]|nr:DUF262 domain-containing protein [Acidimicrobiia bacterium]